MSKKILVAINHPTHVHFFHQAMKIWTKKGHKIKICVRKKDVNTDLLDWYGWDYDELLAVPNQKLKLLLKYPIYEFNIIKETIKFSPDIVVSEAGVGISHASKVCGSKNVLFINNEHAKMENSLSIPFADEVYTPDSFDKQVHSNQINYNSIYPLAYCHPNNFNPNKYIREILPDGLNVVFRLVSWSAIHDAGHEGISNIEACISELENKGANIILTSEAGVPDELNRYVMDFEPHELHDVLYYSDLYFGEGGATAAESALLGTPAIFLNDLQLGYMNELKRNGLVKQYNPHSDIEDALNEVDHMLSTSYKKKYRTKYDLFVSSKTDMKNVFKSVI